MSTLLIGEVARRVGVSPATIRYYEAIGLLKSPPRSSAGYRRYPEETIEELWFIRKAQALGFSLEEIAEILRLSRAGRIPCSQVLSLARQHVSAIDKRIRQLTGLRNQLTAEIAKWDVDRAATCRGLCQIIASAAPYSSDEIGRDREETRRRRRQASASLTRRI